MSNGVWQISGGPTSRAYSDVFFKYGVALLGPGDAGPWRVERSDEEFEGPLVRRFACEAQAGDALLLRTGQSAISAVGLVASEYLHVEAFDDVNGLDLQHARRVRWSALPERYDFGDLVFGGNPGRFGGVASEEVVDYVRRYLNSPPTRWQDAPLPALPEEEPPLDEPPPALLPFVAEVLDLYPLLWDREAFGSHPTEDELIVHFVGPLLRALGWPPERVAIKWRHIDVALFRALPRSPENCCVVIEAKRLGAGVEGALEQAKRYVAELGHAPAVVVTDGVRYRMYDSSRDFEPVAYANVTRLKRSALDLFGRLKRP